MQRCSRAVICVDMRRNTGLAIAILRVCDRVCASVCVDQEIHLGGCAGDCNKQSAEKSHGEQKCSSDTVHHLCRHAVNYTSQVRT